MEARKGSVRFDSCYNFDDRIEPKKTHAEFNNGLLKVIAPISKTALHARKVNIS